ncbi:hypothetical protein SY83_04715 [Paenibacillus swuensis]|uniref:Dockerin domain-containing protein n=1 Tax=Paenibacillus swuensis TaxID=1178515 RepID=A0A172TFK2_9BACL|nr:S8 family serine peptidase [Paenibacillus swuensis]ANE45716.1 hypothetical protein SY83_04715 [Paenibacillus swuensis]
MRNRKRLSRTVLPGMLSLSVMFSGISVGAAAEPLDVKALESRLPSSATLLKSLQSPNLQQNSKPAASAKKSAAGSASPFKVRSVGGEAVEASPALTGVQNYVPKSGSASTITVIVELQARPLAVQDALVKQGRALQKSNHKAVIDKEQALFKASAAKTLGIKTRHTYSRVFNGFSVTLPANQVEQLTTLPGVKAVYPSRTMKVDPIDTVDPLMNDSAPHIGVGSYYNTGFDGSGVKVGVIDTGIDYRHPSLKDAYRGGFDFVDEDSDPMETPPDPNDPEAATSHGTHVSGTVLGRGNPENPNGATGWVRGVAPGADLYAYRVLGPGGSGSEEDVIAAVEQSVADGLDVINLSLGSDANDQNAADSIALNNAVLAGLVVVTSNGNNGPGDFTTGSPAASELAISVGASTPPGNVGLATGASTVTSNTYYDLRVMAYNSAGDYKELEGTPLELVYAGLGTTAEFQGKDVTGKIAFIKRGDIAFVDKIANAKAAGAAAAIIFNRDDLNGHAGVLLEDSLNFIPTFDMKGTDGRALLAALEASGSGTFSLTGFSSYADPGDLMADFSSRGPSLPGLEIKPDISAPGVSIRSSIPSYDGNYTYAYEYLQGTSMAAPHIAGAAALALDKQPELLPDEIKSLLMNTANKLVDGSGTRYSHMVQGAGRVNLNTAIEASAIAMVREANNAVRGGELTPYHTGSISFGKVGVGDSVYRTIDVKNISGTPASYNVTTKWYDKEAGVLSSSKSTVAVAAGETASFDVALAVDAATATGRYEGEVTLTGANGTLNVPVAVYVGEVDLPDTVSDLSLTPDVFSPNKDGAIDTSDVAFKVNLRNTYVSLDVFDYVSGQWQGYITEEAGGIPPGSYIVPDWDGTISDYTDVFTVNDGLYALAPFYSDEGGDYLLEDQAVPFVTDTHVPKSTLEEGLEVEDGIGTIKGAVQEDLLVDVFGDYSGIGVAALYEKDGDWVQADGTIAANGAFTIKVPVGLNSTPIEVYVYDSAGNGTISPAYVVDNVSTQKTSLTVAPSKPEVAVKEGFDVSVDFAQVKDLYSAQFSLTYSSALTKGAVANSVTLSTYQQANHPASGLIVREKVVKLAGGLVRSDYIVSLSGDIGGFSGSGSLASYPFSATKTGKYDLALSNVRLLNSNGQEIEAGTLTGGTVNVVTKKYVVSGKLTAEAFGFGVAYDKVWYQGADGVVASKVEAWDAQGKLAGTGIVNADGTYSISLAAGTYTIKASVPGHIAKSMKVGVSAAKTLHFGVLTAGDVNGDSIVDLKDLNQANKAMGKIAPWTTYQAASADINRDNKVDAVDTNYILDNYGSVK